MCESVRLRNVELASHLKTNIKKYLKAEKQGQLILKEGHNIIGQIMFRLEWLDNMLVERHNSGPKPSQCVFVGQYAALKIEPSIIFIV